jgi:N-succinyldiaminopimelate aminotransferase
VTLLDVPTLAERSVVISSTAKTFSMTGWKVGWAVARPPLTEAVRASHQFLTFCTPGPFQAAMAQALEMDDGYYEELLAGYVARRERLCNALAELGLDVLWPEGTYYASVQVGDLDFADDLDFCRHLTTEVGVAAIPSSFFYDRRRGGRDLVRFCFCKKDETLEEGIRRLRKWRT